MEMSRKEFCRRGALEGLLAWTAYWVTESFLLHILPRLSEPATAYIPPPAKFTLLLLVIYTAAGAVSGALLGLLLSVLPIGRGTAVDEAARLRSGATLILCMVVGGNLAGRLPPGLPAWFFWAFFVPVGFALAAILIEPRRASVFRFLASPWMACATLVALPILFARAHPRPALPAAALLLLPYLVAALILTVWSKPASLQLTVITTFSIVGILLAACFVLRQEPRRISSREAAVLPPGKPNVILIVLDTVRADHLSLYGYERDTSPNLRRLAQEASVFRNAIAPGDMTLSSHASLFTGMYPSWHQAHFNGTSSNEAQEAGQPLDSRYPTIAGILAGKGYDTASIAANYLFLGDGFGLDRGFAYRDSSAPVAFLQPAYDFLLRGRIRTLLARFQQPWQSDLEFRRAEDINAEALGLLDGAKSNGRTSFCFLNYMDAHWPYLPPGRFATLFPGHEARIDNRRYTEMEHEIMGRDRDISPREREGLISQYDGAIAYMDSALGDFIRQLRQRGLYDDTMLIVTADHGEAFGEKHLVGHAVSVYQDMIHVPLLIKYPRQSTAAVVDDYVSLTDLMPTILNVLGYSTPKNVQGRNLWNAPAGGARQILSETFSSPLGVSLRTSRFRRTGQALFSTPLKYIQMSSGDEELYNLPADENEEHNLLPGRPADLFQADLAQYRKAAALENRRQTRARVSGDTLEKLKSLGYASGTPN